MSTRPAPADAKLFQPVQVGDITLAHHVVLAPLTRFRANTRHAHGDLAVEYYEQRASVPGTLLITEATFISPKSGGYAHVPGIYTDEQIDAWKRVTDAVHAQGSYIFMQIWALGRAADPGSLASEDPSFPYVSSSPVPLSNRPPELVPKELTIREIKEYVRDFAQAAANAVHRAGFDGVEIHGAHGYLIDQFTQDTCNKRTDEYGGSIENRTRFALEVIDAVAEAVQAKRTGIRLAPWSIFQDMRMKDPIPTFSYLVQQIAQRQPDLAYIHVPEPRVAGSQDREPAPGESNDFLRKTWAPRPYIAAGGFTVETAIETAETYGDLVAFGRYFISNPDLPLRIKKGIPWTPYNRGTFYKPESPEGYIDFPFAEDKDESVAAQENGHARHVNGQNGRL